MLMYVCMYVCRSIKVFYMTTHSSKSYELRNIHSIRGTTWNIAIQKRKIYNIKIKDIAFIINFGGNKTIRNRKVLIQKGGLGI